MRAAALAKCDLLSSMVGEFPELQGIMGHYYATADGEPADVATAVEEHYLPRGAGGALPGTGVGIAVALADKLDTLAGIFSIGQKPTGTKDPFGLRRAAIGTLRIVVEKKFDIDLRALVQRACALQPVQSDTAATDVWEFMVERLRAYFLDADSAAGIAGASTEMFDAVRASAPPSPLDFAARLTALVQFLGNPEAASLIAANKPAPYSRISPTRRRTVSSSPQITRLSSSRSENVPSAASGYPASRNMFWYITTFR
jgi:glycyl-tRNA synthetase beta chain